MVRAETRPSWLLTPMADEEFDDVLKDFNLEAGGQRIDAGVSYEDHFNGGHLGPDGKQMSKRSRRFICGGWRQRHRPLQCQSF